MSNFTKASFLDDFEIPEITHENIKSQLIKITKEHSVERKQSVNKLPLDERLKLIEKEVYKVLGRYKGFVKVITTEDDFNKYIDKAISVDYIAFDTETNNSLDPLTCKVMGLCMYIPNTKPVYVPLNHTQPGTDILLENQISEEVAKNGLLRFKENNTKMIYHNGKFDIRVINNTLGFYLPIWWDTMIAAQMLDENEMARLKYQFKKHIDPTIGSYNIEKLFTGIPYAWVDPEVFALYAAIDAYDTYKLQKWQEELFKKDKLDKMKKLFLDIEVPITSIVSKMEDDGVCLNEDFTNRLNKKYHDGLDKSIENVYKILEPYNSTIKTYQDAGKLDNPLNFNSPPQLQIIIYEILGIEPLEEFGKSTEKKCMELLNQPFTNALLEYRHYSKMITAFTEALPKLRSIKDNKIHASFNQMGKEENNVRTGRFSCIAKGQKVRVDDGYKNIEDIEIGDTVYCYNNLNKLVTSTVLNKFDNGIRNCIKVHLIGNDSDAELVCTPEHRIFTEKGWIEARCLKNTDRVYGDSNYFYIPAYIIAYGRMHVYDLEINNYHNFIVSKICVHNCTNPNLQQIPSKEKVMRLMFEASTNYSDCNINNNIIELDLCSEVDTPDGWKFADKLVMGDEIYTYDETDRYIKKIKNVSVADKILMEVF